MKKILCLVLVVCIIGVAVGYFFHTVILQTIFPTRYFGPFDELHLGVSKSGPQLSTLIYIAKENGYFKDNKLSVLFTTEPDSTSSRKDVAQGAEDIATTSDFGFVTDSMIPTNLRILATISTSQLVEIIGRKDKGIVDPQSLKGKKIALSTKSYGEFFLGEFLAFNNMQLADITLVPTTLNKVQDAIVAGAVDVAVTNDPYAYQIKQALLKNAVILPSRVGRDNNLLLITSQQALVAKPKALEKFVAALVRAEVFVKEHPKESKEMLAKKFLLSHDFVEQNWPKNSFTVELAQSLLLEMQDEAQWLIENKLTTALWIPNFREYIASDILRKINVEAVTLY